MPIHRSLRGARTQDAARRDTTPFAVSSRRALLRGLAATPIVGALAGCETVSGLFSSDPEASTIVWQIEATPGVNPDISDRPSPIWVRVYQLRSIGVFGGAEFTDLFDHDVDLLGAEMLQRYEYVVTPNQVIEPQVPPVELHEDTRYIGVVAAYHDITRAFWRDTVEVAPMDEAYTLTIKLDRAALRLSLED